MVSIADENSINTLIRANIGDFGQLDNFISRIQAATDSMSEDFLNSTHLNVEVKERLPGEEDRILTDDPSDFDSMQQLITLNIILGTASDLDNLISRITNAVVATSETYDITIIGRIWEETGDPPDAPV